jgi:hypothetical protein
MATLSDMWAAEQAKRILDRVEAELPELESRVDKLAERYSLPERKRGFPHSKEQAADAIYYQLGGIIRDTADEHILDPIELRDAVWRKMTLDSAHSRAKKLDIFADIIHVLRAGE